MPDIVKNIGTHVAMCYYENGQYYWDYQAVKMLLDKYRSPGKKKMSIIKITMIRTYIVMKNNVDWSSVMLYYIFALRGGREWKTNQKSHIMEHGC